MFCPHCTHMLSLFLSGQFLVSISPDSFRPFMHIISCFVIVVALDKEDGNTVGGTDR